MPVYPEKPYYFEAEPIEKLLIDIEEIISSTRETARTMDSGYAVVKSSIAIRQQLVEVMRLSHNLRKEVVRRRHIAQKKRQDGK